MAENTTPENNWESKSSLLSEIIQAWIKNVENNPSGAQENINTTVVTPAAPPPPKKPSEPISPATFLKFMGSLLFVGVVFLWSFLAYISFNPQQAIFFAQMFGIQVPDIQAILKTLVNGSFGLIFFILSIVWIVSLFRAIWTPKELKRKRLLWWLTASIVGILLFSVLSFWIYLFNKIWNTVYGDGSITMYDNDLYTHEASQNLARIYDTSNMIGPVSILFDIRENAKAMYSQNGFSIDSFTINFDGATCSDGTSIVRWTDPGNERSIICTFDQIKTYNIQWTYVGKNILGKSEEKSINFPTIEVRWLLDIKNRKNTRGENIVTLDTSKIKNLGTPVWIYKESGKKRTESSITETVTTIPQIICLQIYNNTDKCDRTFILQENWVTGLEWSIIASQDTVNPKLFHFSYSGINIPQNEIVNTEWLLNNESIICKRGDDTCDYVFSGYGKNKVKFTIETANGDKKEMEAEVNVKEPLIVSRHVRVLNEAWNILNDPLTYQQDLKAFVLSDKISPPETITLDAQDVLSENPWYTLEDTLWKISNGKRIEEKRGKKITVTLDESLRYTIDASYSFRSLTNALSGSVREIAHDSIVIDIARKSLVPIMDISTSSDYVPSLVTIDASRSKFSDGEIKKFRFNFWDGKPATEGDARQEYEYTTPGTKTITLTVVADNGEEASIKKTIVFKDTARMIDFTPSITPGLIGQTIDFEPIGNGQIQDYIWNFWDNTPISREPHPTHIFEKTWTYTISLTIVYTDGTRKSQEKIYEVKESF